LGTCGELPIILGQVVLLQNQSNHSQNWQQDKRNIEECKDLLSFLVWGVHVSMATAEI